MLSPGDHKIKTALISVSDKTGIIEFANELSDLDIEIYSTGGTLKTLNESGINAKSISELTNFPEILDGRLKTLHPAVHGALLAKLDEESHIKQMAENNIKSIDLLIVNLYPFEKTLESGKSHEELIENIDIGGPGMLRAAAKNYEWTAPITDPGMYPEIIEMLKQNACTIPLDYRHKLAGNVFNHTAYYDSLIAGYLNGLEDIKLLNETSIPLKMTQSLRYGENPHQSAGLYGKFNHIFTQLHGKELSYNNIIDIDAASRLIIEFDELTLAIIKHTNPCGVANGSTLSDAFNKAFATDNVSPFGGIVVVNRPIDLQTSETIHSLFTELIIAPEFSDDALAVLTKKKDRRLITVDFDKLRDSLQFDVRSVAGGYLMQATDKTLYNIDKLKVATKRQPTDQEMKSLIFGWKIAKHVKSNSIVYSSDDRTLAIGAGQMSRVDSSRIAIEKAGLMNIDLHGSTMASDAYFPFADGLIEAANAGATAVIQPGGSVRDEEVIAAADENNIAMVLTGMRHFKH